MTATPKPTTGTAGPPAQQDGPPANQHRLPAEQLATPVQFLKGVGPQRAELFERLDLRTARDVLFDFPRDYQDLTDLRAIRDLEEDKLVSVHGTIAEVDLRGSRSGRSIVGVLIQGRGGDHLRGVWFNQPFMRDKLRVGQQVLFSGKPRLSGMRWEMVHPRVQLIESEEESPEGKLLPIYSLTEGLNQAQLRRVVEGLLATHAQLVDEVFPESHLAAHALWPIRQALPAIHFPPDKASLEQARRRFIYQDLFILQLAMALKRHELESGRAQPLEATPKIDSRIRRLFPFELTPGQQQAIGEVAADMARSVPMHRLLQGDVGSGKTAIAVYAMLLAVANGCQATLMAPTEVLARQHAQTLGKLLAAGRVRCGLLVGGLAASERQKIFDQAKAHEIDVLIGTQALVLSGIEFAKLGLVVIDEQHKFGVRQRAHLKHSAVDPHYLVMTATPIPRTVALTLYGDLDVSTLRDKPPGRQPLHTYQAAPDKRADWWEFFRKKLREGRQGYVIAPLVEESEQIASANLQQLYEELANGELEAFRLGLIHGRLTADEKDAAMETFRRGETQVLVATSVVEVGVDVPNATLMTIEGGERFGLSQLHQLRGRVSRGPYPGYCCVFANAETEESQQRLEAFVNSSDGFQLAETDFELRGPGDLFGTKQHGLPPLRIADLRRDSEVLQEARRDAQTLIVADPTLDRPEHVLLKRMVLIRYGKALDLSAVG